MRTSHLVPVALVAAWATCAACAATTPIPEPRPAAGTAPGDEPELRSTLGPGAGSPPLAPPQAVLDDGAAGVEHEGLAALLAEHWGWSLQQHPFWASRLGVHTWDDRMRVPTRAVIDAERARTREFLDRARALPRELLSDADRVTQALFVEELESDVRDEVCRFEEWTLSPRSNPVTEWSDVADLHRVETVRDGRNLVARFRMAPAVIDGSIGNLAAGAKDGLFANAETTRRLIKMVRDELAKPVDDRAMLSPLKAKHADWPPADLDAFRTDLRAAVVQGLAPALRRYLLLLTKTLAPSARPPDKSGLAALPFGAACYAARVRRYTTLDRTPQQVHDTGISEVKRIDGLIADLGRRVLQTAPGDLPAVLDRLRTDRSLYFDTEDAVEEAANRALKAATAAMAKTFGRLPKADCVVRRIPEHEAPFTTIAYYRRPTPDGTKPGEYFVNTWEPQTRPRFEAEVLAFHEAIPGHHLQISIVQELPALPAFRRHMGLTVFVEGWALYTEQLADEMGLYGGDLDRMGMLSFEAWRAARLVVDTGIHSLGWSREQAKAFMAAHTALSPENIDNEVDRYISWPGQALAYKTGQLEIWRLRRDAEKRLGDKFDLRAFHDVVLGDGAVPLTTLRANVRGWIRTQGGVIPVEATAPGSGR